MSFDALAWAAKQRAGSSGAKLVLLGLAECAGRKDALAFPSIAELVEFSDLNRKSIIANLAKLEAAGLIEDTGNCVGRTKQIKVYRLCLETVPKTEQSQKRNSPNFSANSPKNGTRNQLEPVGSEAKASSPRAKFPAPDGVSADQWAAFRGQRKKPLSPHSYKLLNNKLIGLAEHGYPPGEMIDLAIERGWETVFKPRDFSNDRPGIQPSLRGTRPDPALDLYHAAVAAEQRENGQADRRAGPSLPAIGAN